MKAETQDATTYGLPQYLEGNLQVKHIYYKEERELKNNTENQ